MSALVDALQKGQVTGDCTLAAVLDGPEAGSRMLLRGGRPVWQTHSSGVLQRSLSRLQECTATGFLELDGTRVFVERFGAVPQIVVCGGGHVAVSVVRLAKLLGLPVLAMEDRTEYAQDLRDAGADTVFCLPFAQALEQVPGGAETYFVVVTRAHAFDVACLEQILQKPAAYVGMMGSRGRAALVRRQLLEAGADAVRVEAVQAPIGLAIGAKTAEEIALSILAQIVQVKNARPQTEGYPVALLDAMVQAEKRPPSDRGLCSGASGGDGAGRTERPACSAGDDHCTARLHPAGGRLQNAAPARWHDCGQCGRRHHGIPYSAGRR